MADHFILIWRDDEVTATKVQSDRGEFDDYSWISRKTFETWDEAIVYGAEIIDKIPQPSVKMSPPIMIVWLRKHIKRLESGEDLTNLVDSVL